MSTALPADLRPDLSRGAMREYWHAAARGELRLPKCARCSLLSWPPKARCPACGADIEWIASSGRGVVHTFTVVRQHPEPYFRARLPYVVAMVDVEEGVRILANVVDCDAERVRIGMAVAVAFVDVGDGLSLPVFRPAEAIAR
jgi:uncharacterized OB-fold protein